MNYTIREVDGIEQAETIHRLNRMVPETFPELQPRHLEDGFWWLAYDDRLPIGFAGMVPFEPFPGVGYLKRAYVLPEHRGHGLQQRFLFLREAKALSLGWHLLASECAVDNRSSARSFGRAGYEKSIPEQPWGAQPSIYWVKRLTA
jgi:GNAT superfamily N-acetyltransferase